LGIYPGKLAKNSADALFGALVKKYGAETHGKASKEAKNEF
jgi:hypothetical protein